ncbi:hypothetical protein [Sphaerobacter thermophilus]|uniref:Bacteriophage protein n=1 Tax=Sphaerobacter thermophilus (strain ATCC 49802 / DSM 20745 / KCCM 41009 / NCIMB 13125 / S 6022) TaxID=479434 RepID=D1C8V7_SPHTD|nr:hypothetical protein [Sphaerobacter thermophilus]ACZ40250.1 hypothetical protein Sthe_2837 [Sphaerobacter thermophilus DSM 20745]
MAGPGRIPKPAHLVRGHRKVKVVKLATGTPARQRAPRLPAIDGLAWHTKTRAWWRNVWRSPMAEQYTPSDEDGLLRLAILVNSFYQTHDPKLMAEIRLQEQRFGLDPVSRARLRWELAPPASEREPGIVTQLWAGTDPRRTLDRGGKEADSDG